MNGQKDILQTENNENQKERRGTRWRSMFCYTLKRRKMDINELVEKAHKRAKDSGWWNPGKTPLECHMMFVTEIAEATEACRIDQPAFHIADNGKPEGEAVELVDVIIRIADYFGHRGWMDMEDVIKAKMEYNETRPHRHGDKKF